MRLILRAILVIALLLIVILTSAWASLALWYRLPMADIPRGVIAGLFAVLGLFTVVTLFGRRRLKAMIVYAVTFALVCIWWSTIQPDRNADWAPDVARQVTGTVDGDILTLTDLRDFGWRSNTDFTERWENRSYDLSRIEGIDLFMSYWAGPEMAHFILSFSFQGGEQLAWSVEVRRRKGGAFSPLADLFKTNPLVIIAADERDVVGVRSNVRGEDVQIYRLRASPAAARRLLLEYVADANALARKPEFYNSLTTNCTTTVVKMMRAVGSAIPFDWRLIVNGYIPDYAYDHDAVDTSIPLTQLRESAHIAERAKADGLSEDFSKAIRVGVPAPARRTAP
ncbi:MAG TPA: DUF4105 domain-containing protein [Pararhizobium sp.]|uniref:Lnb N-terminal periplasmic domain-containing protein n=1 Tax=Pararhizobium sp. TaxID=1977563 RepID=UPI002BFD3F9B|nr:DUF4105 domain-containing protein [Pararhizobium sp.]HTO29778.1 DUF4105 domain-containing protein [Pararhizobium sp.]